MGLITQFGWGELRRTFGKSPETADLVFVLKNKVKIATGKTVNWLIPNDSFVLLELKGRLNGDLYGLAANKQYFSILTRQHDHPMLSVPAGIH